MKEEEKMEKMYQVFVSSPYKDLEEERKAAIATLMQANCLPACMESFVATDQIQFDVIKKIIDLCDYFVLILGRKYGTICKETGLSYTEMEYNYAVSMNIPILVFVMDSSVVIPQEEIVAKTETDSEMNDKWKKFRKKVMDNRLVSRWHSACDLSSQLAISIMKAKTEIYRPGWQRAYDDEQRKSQIFDIQRTLDLLKENVILHEDLKANIDHKLKLETELDLVRTNKRKYKEYEGRWIQHIYNFTRPYTICTLEYEEGDYWFYGTNYSNNGGADNISFNAQVIENIHVIKKSDKNSFCFITDAHLEINSTLQARGFGEIEFNKANTHEGSGYFYDVESALRQQKELNGEKTDAESVQAKVAALQNYALLKVDSNLYAKLKTLGFNETLEELIAKTDADMAKIAFEYGDQLFPLK